MIGTSVLGQTKNSPQTVSHENFSRSVSCNTRVDTSLNFVCEYYYNQTLGCGRGGKEWGVGLHQENSSYNNVIG